MISEKWFSGFDCSTMLPFVQLVMGGWLVITIKYGFYDWRVILATIILITMLATMVYEYFFHKTLRITNEGIFYRGIRGPFTRMVYWDDLGEIITKHIGFRWDFKITGVISRNAKDWHDSVEVMELSERYPEIVAEIVKRAPEGTKIDELTLEIANGQYKPAFLWGPIARWLWNMPLLAANIWFIKELIQKYR